MSANGRAKVSALPPNLNSDLPVRLSAACPLTGRWSPVYCALGAAVCVWRFPNPAAPSFPKVLRHVDFLK